MGVYSDTNIRQALADGWLFDSEIPDENIQPASVDLTLADGHNHGTVPIMLDPGVKICQVEFCTLEEPSSKPYGAAGRSSSYQDQRGATAARNSAA